MAVRKEQNGDGRSVAGCGEVQEERRADRSMPGKRENPRKSWWDRLLAVSWKWKLLVPFLALSIAGISATVFFSLRSQLSVLEFQEKELLADHYEHLLIQLEGRSEMLGMLASSLARYPEVARLFAHRDRKRLLELLSPIFSNLKKHFGISQIHFHLPKGVSFLRVHKPHLFGDDLFLYRESIRVAFREKRVVSGLERGATGTGLRGVAPVYWKGKVVGTVEVGWNFSQELLDSLKSRLRVDLCLYDLNKSGSFVPLFSTTGCALRIPDSVFAEALSCSTPLILIGPPGAPHKSILLGSLKDFSGLPLMLIGIVSDRTFIQNRINHARNVMLAVQVLVILASSALIYWIVLFFLRPIHEIVDFADEIARGKRKQGLKERPMDEMGMLTRSLNRMLTSLNQSQEQLEQYASVLKVRVAERTSELIASEEKYRTLVENVPLVVYRTTPDGMWIFVNHYIEKLLGLSVEQVIGKRFWIKEYVLPEDLSKVEEAKERVIQKGESVSVEYRCKAKDGRILYIVDRAIPQRDLQGVVLHVDGIMVDATEHHNLQEKIIRTEELKTLHDVSMQLAHEIRNPLMSVGGFARRLLKVIPKDDPNRKTVAIIVEEAARLEMILKMILSYIQPFDVHRMPTDVNDLLERVILDLQEECRDLQVTCVLDPDPYLGMLSVDRALMANVFKTLLKNALLRIPKGETIRVATHRLPETSHIEIRYPVRRLSDDYIEHFFFPFVGPDLGDADLDLSRAKMIVHKHDGLIEVSRSEEGGLLITIDLPNT